MILIKNTPNAVIYIEEGDYFYNFNLPLLKEIEKIMLFGNRYRYLVRVQKMTARATALFLVIGLGLKAAHDSVPSPMKQTARSDKKEV